MTQITYGILIVITILLIYNVITSNITDNMCSNINQQLSENMTRIFRGVGIANDANEIPVASGVINSAPILDYSHTYFDGVRTQSCDQCSNGLICPNCPQYRDNATKEGLLAWDDNATAISDYVTGGCGLQHDLDTDAEFTSGREARGACASRKRLQSRSEIRGDLLNISDVTFDRAGELALNNTAGKCKNTKSVCGSAHSGVKNASLAEETRRIYMDKMGLGPLNESPIDYTYLSYNGRVYKDPYNLQDEIGNSYTI